MRILTLVLFFLASSTVFAQSTYHINATGGGVWVTASTWTGGSAYPGNNAGDIAVLDNAMNTTLTLSSSGGAIIIPSLQIEPSNSLQLDISNSLTVASLTIPNGFVVPVINFANGHSND